MDQTREFAAEISEFLWVLTSNSYKTSYNHEELSCRPPNPSQSGPALHSVVVLIAVLVVKAFDIGPG